MLPWVSHILGFWDLIETWICDHFTLSHLQTHFDAIAADDFWKHYDHHEQFFLLCPQCFQLYLTNFYGDFSGFCHHVFKVARCRFVVNGKGLKDRRTSMVVDSSTLQISYLERSRVNDCWCLTMHVYSMQRNSLIW